MRLVAAIIVLASSGCSALGASGSASDVAATVDDVSANETAAHDTAAHEDTDVAGGYDAETKGSAVACSDGCPAGWYCPGDPATALCAKRLCNLPDSWPGAVQKVSMFEVPGGAGGCDLDGDGAVDNAVGSGLSMLLGQVNDALKKSIGDGTLVIAVALPAAATAGTPFDAQVLQAALDASNPTCDKTSPAANCAYVVLPASFDPAGGPGMCPPRNHLTGLVIAGSQLSSAVQSQPLLVTIPVAGSGLTLPLREVRLQGTATVGPSGELTTSGVLCGMILRADVDAALAANPDFAGLGRSGASALPDSFSFALSFSTVAGHLVGLAAP
ncbi:MAG: hypothetical protein HY902_20645 [Deltaproteobacteria bacterium]|nr:hypothetical protein [Deltaproteobacteria bacterium]